MMYDEQELKTIISRAIQLQRDAGELYDAQRYSGQAGKGAQLSSDELEEIAKEAGLSPTYMRQAMAEFQGLPQEESFFIDTFNKNEMELLGFAPGRLSSASWAELRSSIEKDLATPGVVRREQDGIQWEARPKGVSKVFKTKKQQSAEIKQTGNKLKIRLRKNVRTQRTPELPAWGLILIAMAFVVLMFESGDAAPLIGVVAAGAMASICFSWAEGRKAKARQQLNDLMLEMQQILARHEAGVATEKAPQQDQHNEHTAAFSEESSREEASSHTLKNKLKN